MSSEGEKIRRSSSRRGNVISPQPVSTPAAMQNVFDFLHDYVPQAVSGHMTGSQREERRERVLWASFETGDINDLSLPHHSGITEEGNQLPLLLILGLTTGYSIWSITPCGDAKELFTAQGEGEVARVVRLTQTPQKCDCVKDDSFADDRPIVAVVKKGRHSSSGSTVGYSSLQFVSLRLRGDNVVRRVVFKTRPIVDVKCSRRVVVVILQKRIVVLDAGTYNNRFVIRNNYPSLGFPCNPIALGARWLAFPDVKLSSKHQSVGGVSNATPPSVATTVLKNVKKGISALTETITGLAGKTQQLVGEGSEPTQPQAHDPNAATANIVSIIDLNQTYPEETKVQDLERQSGIIAHFVAHTGPDIHVAALCFNTSGVLLVSASTEGHHFHVFHILPHPRLSSETAVHHLYTLYRGATTGIVQDVCFTADSRWVGVSTLNGTTHIFPITPYGGDVTVRTHTSRHVVNQLSRFHTSAGFDSIPAPHSQQSPPSALLLAQGVAHSPPREPRENPSSVAGFGGPATAAASWHSPRSLPLPVPITVSALQQIKQPYLSTTGDQGGRGQTSGLTYPLGGGSTRGAESGEPFVTLAGPDSICVRATFMPAISDQQSPSGWARKDPSSQGASYSLYVIGSSGLLTEHSLEPQRLSTALDGEDAPIELSHSARLCWKLLSPTPLLSGPLPLPLADDNPLVTAYLEYCKASETARASCEQSLAKPASDGEWLSQVEILTHAPPSRRLWMGPQFSFKTYQSPSPTLPSSSSPAVLLTPSPPNTIIYAGSLNSHTNTTTATSPAAAAAAINTALLKDDLEAQSDHRQKQDKATSQVTNDDSAVLFTSDESPLVDLLSDPPELQDATLKSLMMQQHTSPLPMPLVPERVGGDSSNPASMDPGVLEVFGSWSKVAPRLEGMGAGLELDDVERQLEDAINERDSPSTTAAATTVVTTTGLVAKTGFSPPGDKLT